MGSSIYNGEGRNFFVKAEESQTSAYRLTHIYNKKNKSLSYATKLTYKVQINKL